MILIAHIVLLIGYGCLVVIYYEDKKYKTAAVWALIFLYVLYIIIEPYIPDYTLL
ncbi:hypothetical protein N8858_06350 [Flavobacteriaceae bacterium]|jgi:hypothetical protein|nr:hypothetical protein [Flavobacteriaceae bacterium]